MSQNVLVYSLWFLALLLSTPPPRPRLLQRLLENSMCFVRRPVFPAAEGRCRSESWFSRVAIRSSSRPEVCLRWRYRAGLRACHRPGTPGRGTRVSWAQECEHGEARASPFPEGARPGAERHPGGASPRPAVPDTMQAAHLGPRPTQWGCLRGSPRVLGRPSLWGGMCASGWVGWVHW